jgi:hypothetical protein
MKLKLSLIILSILLSFNLFGQDNFSVYFGHNYASFRYFNSQGEQINNISSRSGLSYGLNYSKVFDSGVFIRPEIGFRNQGAEFISGTPVYNTSVIWDLHYADLNFGAGFMAINTLIKPYAGVSIYSAYLFKANQYVNNSMIDLIDTESFKYLDFGFNIFAGMSYSFSEYGDLFMELNYLNGLNQIEQNLNGSGLKEELYNNAFTIKLGLRFNIIIED